MLAGSDIRISPALLLLQRYCEAEDATTPRSLLHPDLTIVGFDETLAHG